MARWIGSPNFTTGRGGQKISGVIIHWMVGTLASTDSVFQNQSRNTSAHYGVEDGKVHQYVKEEDTAYHAGHWGTNQTTIGIEHSAAPGRPASDATYESSARLIADASKRHGFAINRRTVRGHNEIVATQCPGTMDLDRLIKKANELLGQPTTPSVPVPQPPQPAYETVKVAVDSLFVRSAPNTSAPLRGSQVLSKGDTFQIVGRVQGQSVSGVSTWVVSRYGNYVWAGGLVGETSPVLKNSSGTVEILADTLNARSGPGTGYPVRAQFKKGSAQYVNTTRGEKVTANGKTSDVWLQSLNGNWFSSVWTTY
jgi:N-acetylmuramoyl-L-alanine amidase